MAGQPVVAAVDGSDEALHAAEWAAREARRRSAPLRIVSVAAMPSRMHVRHSAVSEVTETAREVAAGAALRAARRVTEVVPGLIVDIDVLTGAPATAVTDSGCEAVMLVVGARGLGGLGAMILGSVSRRVAANAGCPVVVVREQPSVPRRVVVVGIRDPRNCGPALPFAFEEAALHGMDLVAIHAWHGITPGRLATDDPLADPGLAWAEARWQIADTLAAWQEKYPTVNATVEVVQAPAGEVLSIRSATSKLVVLGRNGRQPSGRETGVAHVRRSVLSHAQGPVAVVPA